MIYVKGINDEMKKHQIYKIFVNDGATESEEEVSGIFQEIWEKSLG